MESTSVHEASSLSGYLSVLRRRQWIVLACAILIPNVALVLSLRQTPVYASSADVLLSRQNLASTLTGTNDSSLANDQRLSATQSELAHTRDVAAAAIKLSGSNALGPDALLTTSTVGPKGNTDLLEFTVRHANPALAQLFATSFARAYVAYRAKLDTKAVASARAEVTRTLGRLAAAGREKSDLYTSLEEKEQQLATLQTLQTSQASVTRPADGAAQVSPRPFRSGVLGLALGLVLGVGLAFAIDAIDTRVRSAREVGDHLGLPLLARIPPPPRKVQKEGNLVMLAQPTGTQAEAFRMLRTNLDFARLTNDRLGTILVMSAVEQEGRSTTAANLAIALARSGNRVALVDLDLRRPYLDRFFHLLHAHGITDVALNNVSLLDGLQRIELATGSPQTQNGRHQEAAQADEGYLDVLVSGGLPPDPGEFVGTARLQGILEELRMRYDIVLLDSPPALRVGDAMTLSASADGILVVSRLNLVRRTMLGELKRQLDSVPAAKIGFVVTGESEGAAYGSGYGYGGYGYGDPAKIEKERAKAAAQSTDAVEEADRV